MGAASFKARHCGQVFEGAAGAAELAVHMKAHRAERRGRYLTLRNGPSHAPLPWKAPRANPAKLAELELELAA